MGLLEPFWPLEYRGVVRIVTLQMPCQTCWGFGVSDTSLTEDFFANGRETRIVLLEFVSRVDVIVVMIILAVVVEPRLNPLREVFVVIHAGVFSFPKTSFHGLLIRRLQPSVEGRVDIHQSSQMDIVREFMNEDAFGGVRVTWIGKKILFAAGTKGI